jgi:iron complex outermembrane recepter protein
VLLTTFHACRNAPSALRLHSFAGGCALLRSRHSGIAAAQEAPPGGANMTRVTASGICRGIEDAISVKRDATSIVESISAEDIGKLPDTSIAESIARLPGLTAQPVARRAQVPASVACRPTSPRRC